MTSFIVVAKDKEKRLTYARDYCTKLEIDPFDITLIERENAIKQNTTSIGIEDIKNMQKKIFFKPLRSQTKAIIIEESHLLTNEAQNALLKVLEEPPMHTILILSAETKEVFLPTIISRCKVIELEEDKLTLSEKDLEDYKEFIENLPSMTIGESLKKAEILAKDKEKGTEWVEKLILVLREKTLKVILGNSKISLVPNKKMLATLDALNSFQQLHTLLKTTNVNPRFAFENTLLALMS